MTCIVYREGRGTIEHGIECESTTCEPEEVGSYLASGWLQDPPGYVAPEPVTESEIEEDPTDPVADDSDELFDSLVAENQAATEDRDRLVGEVDALGAELEAAKKLIEAKDEEIASLNEALRIASLPAESTDEKDGEEEDGADGDVTLDSVEVVRQKAKDAGIEGWDTKRVKTLRKELESL